jgi:hypothetical protein
MNKEQQALLEDAYKNYAAKTSMDVDGQYTKEEFINKIKTDGEFAKKWELKIEERELSNIERMEYYGKHYMKEHDSMSFDNLTKIDYDGLNIPTKLITITYNDKKIESYE